MFDVYIGDCNEVVLLDINQLQSKAIKGVYLSVGLVTLAFYSMLDIKLFKSLHIVETHLYKDSVDMSDCLWYTVLDFIFYNKGELNLNFIQLLLKHTQSFKEDWVSDSFSITVYDGRNVVRYFCSVKDKRFWAWLAKAAIMEGSYDTE